MMVRRHRAAPLAALIILSLGVGSAASAPTVGPDSHLPVPRFVSLKAQGANGRHGPGVEHRIDWIYERQGLPLQVTGESGPWRRVRDPDGAEVWMHGQNLNPRRTVMVRDGNEVALRNSARDGANVVAYLAPGVIGALTGCHGEWRRITVGGRVGWVGSDAVWGPQDCAGV